MKGMVFFFISVVAHATNRPEYCPETFQFKGIPGSKKVEITLEGKKTSLYPEGNYTFQRAPAAVQIFSNHPERGGRSELPEFELTHADGKEASLKYHTQEETGLCVLKLQ